VNNLAYKGRRDFSDRERAMVVFFLFASQDTMSSGPSGGPVLVKCDSRAL
jgi:hypothetical protein